MVQFNLRHFPCNLHNLHNLQHKLRLPPPPPLLTSLPRWHLAVNRWRVAVPRPRSAVNPTGAQGAGETGDETQLKQINGHALHSTAYVPLCSLCQTWSNLKTHPVSETENRTSCLTTGRQTITVSSCQSDISNQCRIKTPCSTGMAGETGGGDEGRLKKNGGGDKGLPTDRPVMHGPLPHEP